MRKIKIGFISPYEAMVPMVEELGEKQEDLQVATKVGNLEEGVKYAKEMERSGYDLIISRGGTAGLIRNAISLPVIDVHMSGYDLLRTIMLTEGHSKEKKVLVGFTNITLGAASIINLLEIDMTVVTIQDANEVDVVLKSLKDEKHTIVLGDVVTVAAAQRLGMSGFLIQSGRESIMEAFEEARRQFVYQQKSQRLVNVMRYFLGARKMDMLIATAQGDVIFENWSKFPGSPISQNEWIELVNQAFQTGNSIFRTVDTFQIRVDLFQEQEEKVAMILFEDLLTAYPNITIEQIDQLPYIVTESAAMKRIKNLVEKPLMAKENIVLIGKAGVGKKELARYIHAVHGKNGFFVSVDLDKLDQVEESFANSKIDTVFIHLSQVPELKKVNELQHILAIAEQKNVQIIFSQQEVFEELKINLGMDEAVIIHLPSLQERTEDIETLVQQFLMEFHQELGTQPIKVRKNAIEYLKNMQWPGNTTI
ncbi:transcriptional regulator with PAS, ATPase and Fis domain [Planomicrobium stackebrandtii]|uniref:Transcriptional regulator with PAS, ATPase and Fis domain n=1 Tax=Planomicrobium stackebrandtii TaxID=253160 RepID=A0ABU0GWK6_9BACL|nr:PrpR N-terminal domain-containing protein [Planomicrobium stackebrandtii]MDQ0428935.1 transcriptional regulator with PAS, ATPase and Fis domain [Planomicrobium stackebrandtii]